MWFHVTEMLLFSEQKAQQDRRYASSIPSSLSYNVQVSEDEVEALEMPSKIIMSCIHTKLGVCFWIYDVQK